jgi:transcriptional regulator with XRE-family HTH domain
MTRIYYGEIERGHKNIELKTLERICKGLDVPIWQVMRDAEADDQ